MVSSGVLNFYLMELQVRCKHLPQLNEPLTCGSFSSPVQICVLSIYLRAVQVIFRWIHSCVLPPACSPKQNGVFPAAPTLLKLTVSCCVIHLWNFWRCFRPNLPIMFGVHVWKQLSSVHLINQIFVWTDILTMKINYRQAEDRRGEAATISPNNNEKRRRLKQMKTED